MKYTARVRFKLKDAHGPDFMPVMVTASEDTPLDDVRKAMRRRLVTFFGKSATVARWQAIEPIPLAT